MKTQYNFKIEDTLKQELEQVQQNSNIQNKEEFLSQLLNSFKHSQANETDTTIDMSKYEDIEAETKAKLSDTFKHIIYTIQANTTDMKQQAIGVEKEKLSIIDERKSFQYQLEQLKAQHNQKLLDAQKKYDEKTNADKQKMTDLESLLSVKVSDIEKVEKEKMLFKQKMEQAQAIAEQVKVVISENKELREATQELTEALEKVKELEQTKFKINFENEQLHQQLEKTQDLEEKMQNLQKENIILTTKLEMQSELPTAKQV